MSQILSLQAAENMICAISIDVRLVMGQNS